MPVRTLDHRLRALEALHPPPAPPKPWGYEEKVRLLLRMIREGPHMTYSRTDGWQPKSQPYAEPAWQGAVARFAKVLNDWIRAGDIVLALRTEEVAAAVAAIDAGKWKIEKAWNKGQIVDWYPFPVDPPIGAVVQPTYDVKAALHLWHLQTGKAKPKTLEQLRRWLIEVAEPLAHQWDKPKTRICRKAGTL